MNKTLGAAAIAVGLLMSSTAMAQAYVGLGGGMTKWTDDCEGAISCDKSDSGSKFFLGYKFAPNLAAEVVVMDFGKLTGKLGGGQTLTIKGSSVGIGAAFTGDLTPSLEGVARLGLASSKAKVAATGLSDSDTGTTAYAGLGLGYKFNSSVSVDCAIDFSNIKYEGATDNVMLFSLGLSFRF